MSTILVPASNFTVLTSTLGNSVSFSKQSSDEGTIWEGFEINDSGVEILRFLQENNDPRTFAEDFRAKYGLEEEANSWIMGFISDLLQRGALELCDEKTTDVREDISFHRTITINETKNATTPQSSIIEITNTCNEACEHCYLSSGPKRTDRIDFDSFTALCDEMAAAHVYRVQLTGGEVFMHPRATDMIAYALDRFPEVALFTNATILSEKVLDLLRKNKERLVISVSLDSVDPEIHDRLRNHRNAHKKTSRNIRRMTDAGLFVRITSVLFDENMWELAELAQQASDLGARLFVFNFVEGFGRGKEMAAEQTEGVSKEYNDYVKKVVDEYRDVIPVIQEEVRDEAASRDNCGAGSNSVVISANGDIRPCNLFPEEVSFGNVLHQDWEEIFSSPLLRKIHDLPSPGVENGCSPKCPNRIYCQGCILHGITQNAWENHPHYCSWVKTNNAESIVEMFVGKQ
ncbi:radical SAM protein [Corynebacterium tuberculostearicum]|nr:radical SAM protein [Corynebacterium tuberculostearicum]